MALDCTEHTVCSVALPTLTLCTQNHSSLLGKFLFTNLQQTGANRLQLRAQKTIRKDEESLTTSFLQLLLQALTRLIKSAW